MYDICPSCKNVLSSDFTIRNDEFMDDSLPIIQYLLHNEYFEALAYYSI